jgi:hypothetical protein
MGKTIEPSEYKRFLILTDSLLTVPHDEIQRREAEYKKTAPKGAHKRGPKPKKAK